MCCQDIIRMISTQKLICIYLIRAPRWNISTRIEQPYVTNGITARCGGNSKIIERPKTCKSKLSNSLISNSKQSLPTSTVALNRKKSRSTQNCLDISKQQPTIDNTNLYSQPYASSSIAFSMSTSSSNLSSFSSTYNAVPSLEVVGTSTQLSISPFSSGGCTPRGPKCNRNTDVKTSPPEGAKVSENTQTSLSISNNSVDCKRPKSSSGLEIGHYKSESSPKHNLNTEEVNNNPVSHKKLNRNGNENVNIEITNTTLSPLLSPSKRGARRIRSREIVEELQNQVSYLTFLFG